MCLIDLGDIRSVSRSIDAICSALLNHVFCVTVGNKNSRT